MSTSNLMGLIGYGIHSGKMHGEAINAYGNIMGIVLAGLPHLVTG